MSQGSTIMQAVREVPDFAARYANLANARLGAAVVSVTDEFFGARDRLIRTEDDVGGAALPLGRTPRSRGGTGPLPRLCSEP